LTIATLEIVALEISVRRKLERNILFNTSLSQNVRKCANWHAHVG